MSLGRSGAVAAAALLMLGSAAAQSLTAGDIDDHLNWDQYLSYLDRAARHQGLPDLAFEDRITLYLQDADGEPLSHAQVSIGGEGVVRWAGSDGIVRLLPQLDGLSGTDLSVTVASGGVSKEFQLTAASLGADRSATLTLNTTRALPDALDLMFVIDTTGSMSDELRYLTQELDGIVAGVAQDHGNLDLRLGLTVYRDAGDDYVVRELGFTDDLQTMQGWLSAQHAAGGGDYPEAMDEALERGLAAQWRGPSASQVLFLVADAPPHQQGYDHFLDQALVAREKGIHIYPLAASGVADEAEYLMRAAAVMTQGRHLFLTDDSGIGNPHAEPRIACYVVTSLDDLLVRIVASELTGARVEPDGQDIVRTVGNYEMGVCLGDPVEVEPQQNGDPVAADGAPGGDHKAGSSGGSASEADASTGATEPSPSPSPSPSPTVEPAAEPSPERSADDADADTPGPALALVALALLAVAARRRR